MKLNLRNKLFAAFGVVLVFMALLGVVAILQVQAIESQINAIANVTGPTVALVGDLWASLWEANLEAEEGLVDKELTNVQTFDENVATLNAEFDDAFKAIQVLVTEKELQATLEQVRAEKALFNEYVAESTTAHKLELENESKTKALLEEYDAINEELAAELAPLNNEEALKLETALLKGEDVTNDFAAETDLAKLAEHRDKYLALQQAVDAQDAKVNNAQVRALLARQHELVVRQGGLFDTYEQQLTNESLAVQRMDEAEVSADQIATFLDTIKEKTDALNDQADDQASIQARTALWSIIGVGLTAAVIGLVMAFLLARSIANAAGVVTRAAIAIAEGDLAQSVMVKSKDELGEMAAAIQRMIAYMQQMAGAAGRLAQGDVAADVTPQSDKDVLGNAFSQMITYQQQMAEAAGRLAQGDLTTNITPQSDKDGLGNAFSLMIANLRNLISQVADTADTVGAASDQLATAASQAGQASQQVTSTIQQIAQGTTQQTQSVAEATNNTEQTARAAEGIAKGAQEQAQSVQKTAGLVGEMANIVDQVGQVTHSVGEANAKMTQAARHGVSVVGQTSQGMDTIRARTVAAADKVKEMSNRSKEIGRIVETIDDIADKTDMLALNAAVEAARAGEHGRGFAVVADQVRKLSEDSKGATRDIAELIERVQETVREAIGAMESTVIEVDNGTRLAGDTARSLEEILLAAEGAAALATQIGGAVSQLRHKSEGVVDAMGAVSAIVEENTAVAEEMAAGSQQVMQAMEGVASVAEENSASAEEVSASAEEMSAQVEEVVASAQELSSLAEQLRAAVAQFRVDEASPTPRSESSRSWEVTRGSASRQRSMAVATPLDRQGNGVTNLNLK